MQVQDEIGAKGTIWPATAAALLQRAPRPGPSAAVVAASSPGPPLPLPLPCVCLRLCVRLPLRAPTIERRHPCRYRIVTPDTDSMMAIMAVPLEPRRSRVFYLNTIFRSTPVIRLVQLLRLEYVIPKDHMHRNAVRLVRACS